MMTKDEALKMAIEWVEGWKGVAPSKIELLRVLREALEQPAQEPVAWLYKRENSSGGWYVVTNYEKEHDNGTRNIQCYDIPLYTHPAPSWQGLSDDELSELFAKCGWVEENDNLRELGFYKHARMLEQALKEKNYE